MSQITVPIRRQLTSVWVGALALIATALASAGAAALILAALPGLGGAVALILAALLWIGGFFGSVPWQRRLARAIQLRSGPHLIVRGTTLRTAPEIAPPLGPARVAQAGWVDETTGSGQQATRWRETYALLSDGAAAVMLWADDSMRAAERAGWPRVPPPPNEAPRIRLWAADLIQLAAQLQGASPPGRTL